MSTAKGMLIDGANCFSTSIHESVLLNFILIPATVLFTRNRGFVYKRATKVCNAARVGGEVVGAIVPSQATLRSIFSYRGCAFFNVAEIHL